MSWMMIIIAPVCKDKADLARLRLQEVQMNAVLARVAALEALIVHFLSSSVLGFGLFWEGVSGVGKVSGLNFENIKLGQLHVFGFVQTGI